METCPTCNGDGLEAVWNEAEQMYDERTCTTCSGEGAVFMSDRWEASPPVVDLDRPQEDDGYGAWPKRGQQENKQMDEGLMDFKTWHDRVKRMVSDPKGIWKDDAEVFDEATWRDLWKQGLDPREAIEQAFEADPELPSIDDQLAQQGLRRADPGQAGWYVMVTDSDDEGTFGTKVWATDLPKEETQRESADFDKFMDVTLIKENRRLVDAPEDNPQRRRAQANQNRPLDRTRFVKRGQR